MFGVQKNRLYTYEMLPCKALKAIETGTECPQVQIENILGSGERTFTLYSVYSVLGFETVCTVQYDYV